MSKKIIAKLFRLASDQEARELVIESWPEKLALDYCWPDGRRQSLTLPKKLESDLMLNLRQLLKMAPDELTWKKYAKISDKNGVNTFYITILPGKYGEKIVISLVRKEPRSLSLKQLGWQSEDRRLVEKALKSKAGLILISGPILSGKSTTLYSLLRTLNSPRLNIYLLEKEREEEIPGVNSLLKKAANWEKVLSHDSEIIAAELEDRVDFLNAVRTANSGRLVIGVLTANSAIEALAAFLALPLPLKLKLDNLKLITNQRLAPLKRPLKTRTKNQRRQIAVFEILTLSPGLKKFLSQKFPDDPAAVPASFWPKLEAKAIKEGFRPLAVDLKRKIKDGLLAT